MAADPAALVWIVEGEGCADALHGLGMVGVTSGSATSDNAADWQPMHGRHCVLWPDNIKPGADYATRVAERLQALGCTVEVIDIDTLQLPVGGDVVDWLVQMCIRDRHSNACQEADTRKARLISTKPYI